MSKKDLIDAVAGILSKEGSVYKRRGGSEAGLELEVQYGTLNGRQERKRL